MDKAAIIRYVHLRLKQHEEQLPGITSDIVQEYWERLESVLPHHKTRLTRKDIRKCIIQDKKAQWTANDWNITDLCFPAVTGPFGSQVFPEPTTTDIGNPLPRKMLKQTPHSNTQETETTVQQKQIPIHKLIFGNQEIHDPQRSEMNGTQTMPPARPPLMTSISAATIQAPVDSSDNLISDATIVIEIVSKTLSETLFRVVNDVLGGEKQLLENVTLRIQNWLRDSANEESPFAPITIDGILDYPILPRGINIYVESGIHWGSLSNNVRLQSILKIGNDDGAPTLADINCMIRFCRWLKYESDNNLYPLYRHPVAVAEPELEKNELCSWIESKTTQSFSTKSLIIHGSSEYSRQFLIEEASKTYHVQVITAIPVLSLTREWVLHIKKMISSLPFELFFVVLTASSESDLLSSTHFQYLLELSKAPNLFVITSLPRLETKIAGSHQIRVLSCSSQEKRKILASTAKDLNDQQHSLMAAHCLNMTRNEIQSLLSETSNRLQRNDAISFEEMFLGDLRDFAIKNSSTNPELVELLADLDKSMNECMRDSFSQKLVNGIWNYNAVDKKINLIGSTEHFISIEMEPETLPRQLLHWAAISPTISGCSLINRSCIRRRAAGNITQTRQIILNLIVDAMQLKHHILIVDREYLAAEISREFKEYVLQYITDSHCIRRQQDAIVILI